MNRTNVSFRQSVRFFVILGITLNLIFCTQKTDEQFTDKIIAVVGDKTITVDELIARAELTIRPRYCSGDDDNHKKIILNSLIAEKLLAIEAGDNNELAKSESFEQHLKGRKEQAIRNSLYHHDFYEKIKLDTAEIKMVFRIAGRKYDLAYFTIKDNNVAKQVRDKMKQGQSFKDVYSQLYGDEDIPRREVKWNVSEHEAIYNALFVKPVYKDQVIGPIQIENNYFTVIKILGWTDQHLLSNSEVQRRLNDVKKKLKERHATVQFREYIYKIMRGKKVDFSEDTFYELVNILGPAYMKTKQSGILSLNQKFWVKDSDQVGIDKLENNLGKIEDHPLLSIDNEIWTIADFKGELISHPLVFRKQKIRKGEFPEQLKLAIVDMIRDKYITKEAYKKGYDQTAEVQREVSMWSDFYYALFQKNKYIRPLSKTKSLDKNYLQIIEQYLDPYIDQLRKRYNDQIKVNAKLLDDIQLTNIDIMVMKSNVPFPQAVPLFPMLTTNNNLDYSN